jgi:hypothetical protein
MSIVIPTGSIILINNKGSIMKVSNVSIFKDVTEVEAIHAAIEEMFNSKASAGFLGSLVISHEESGVVGRCEKELEYSGTLYTSYFFVSELPSGFKRVEHCTCIG